MIKTYLYRLYPTKAQTTLLENILEECRWIYNKTLEIRKDAWEVSKESFNYYTTSKYLIQWKKERPTLKIVHSQTLQDVQIRVDLAFNAFFRRAKTGENPGYPRFKGFMRYDSFSFPQSGFILDGNKLKISKIGWLKIHIHRNIVGSIKKLTIKRHSTDKWYASFYVEYENAVLPKSDKVVGIDMGLQTFATLSDETKIENPKFFKREEKALAKAQRKLSKAEKGTSERAKRRKVVSRIHERITNRRSNFIHQESRKIINKFGLIAVEKLNINNMNSFIAVNKSIRDAAWSSFIAALSYKAEEAGRTFVSINPAYTSQLCSRCHSLVPKTLEDRIHSCPICGLQIDRDLNAAYNILALGIHSVGRIPRSPDL